MKRRLEMSNDINDALTPEMEEALREKRKPYQPMSERRSER